MTEQNFVRNGSFSPGTREVVLREKRVQQFTFTGVCTVRKPHGARSEALPVADDEKFDYGNPSPCACRDNVNVSLRSRHVLPGLNLPEVRDLVSVASGALELERA